MIGRGILRGIAGCLAVVAASFACASDDDDSEATGTLGAACYPDDTCDDGLVCKADRCLASSGSDASSAGSASNTGGSSGRGGGAGSGGARPLDDAGGGGVASSAGRGGSGGLSGAGGTIGSGGRGGTGGITSTGGSGGRGSAGTGGTAGSGGAGGILCEPQTAPSECDVCVQANCCAEWLACTDECADEVPCIVPCTDEALLQNGFVDRQTVYGCASSCAVGPVIAATSDALVSCILGTDVSADASTSGCGLECFSLLE